LIPIPFADLPLKPGNVERFADWQSAIQQTGGLRYGAAAHR
jgi:hypothetical protein